MRHLIINLLFADFSFLFLCNLSCPPANFFNLGDVLLLPKASSRLMIHAST